MMAATPATAPTPMPAFAPVLSPPALDENAESVSLGRYDEAPGTGDVTAVGLIGSAVGVNDTPIFFASDDAYAVGNFDRSVASQPMLIASAIASPDGTRVVFVIVVHV